MRFILYISLLLALYLQSATNTAVSGFREDVGTAWTNSVDGDTVSIPAGTFAWTNKQSFVGKAVNIRGAGTNQTFLVSSNGSTDSLWFFNNYTANRVKIYDITFIGGDNDQNGFIESGVRLSTNAGLWIDNCNFSNITYRAIVPISSYTPYLIRGCAFEAPGDDSTQFVAPFGSGTNAWKNQANPMGTTNQVVLEDCVFNFAGGQNDGFMDSYDGAFYTFRHGRTYGPGSFGNHGLDSGSYPGSRGFEIYNVVATNSLAAKNRFIHHRAGIALLYNIEIQGGYNNFHQFTYYRSCTNLYPNVGANWGANSGTNPYDNNSDTNGYICGHQPGAISGDWGSMVIYGCYETNNTISGSDADFGFWNNTGCDLDDKDIIVSGRDYFNDTMAGDYTQLGYPHPWVVQEFGLPKPTIRSTPNRPPRRGIGRRF